MNRLHPIFSTIMLPSIPCQRTAASVLAVVFLLVGAGCKPAPPPGSGQATPPVNGDASAQPNASDFNAFFQNLLPSVVKVSDLKTDPPVRMPDTPPDSRIWLINVKITLTPVEDLLALPAPEDTQVIDGLVSELNVLIAWRNAYARSPYARVYGAFDVQTSAAPVPQLLVVQQAKNKPLVPLYGKIAAEWQVDHWQFTNVDLELPRMGQLRSSFAGGPTMINGSPEVEAFLEAERKSIADAKQRQVVIESNYTKDLLAITKPGTIYRGQVSHLRGVLPCEVRFLETPGADPNMATFEVRVPQEPSYQYVYSAALVPKVPLKIDSDGVASQFNRVPSGDANTDVPVGNLIVNFVRGTGKTSTGGNLAGMMLSGAHGLGSDKPLLLLGGRLKGVIASFNGDFSVDAELSR